jgi:hypothetical protein
MFKHEEFVTSENVRQRNKCVHEIKYLANILTGYWDGEKTGKYELNTCSCNVIQRLKQNNIHE